MKVHTFCCGRVFFLLPNQWIRVMKLTSLLLFLSILSVSARTIAQKVTIDVRSASLESVLKTIRLQTGYDYVADERTLQTGRSVTIKLNNVLLDEALQKIFTGQPLSYTLNDKVIAIKIKEEGLIDRLKDWFAAIEVSGKVVDEHNQPLAGATVIEKGTGNSTTTDAKGVFLLRKVDPRATIVISFIGFEKRELNATSDAGTVVMKVTTRQIDAVMIVAYGQTTQRLATGNVSTATAKTFEEQPVSDPILALEGRVPGVFISQATGFPGSGVSVQIQGQNSISQGNDPLYVIDGVPYTSQLLPTVFGGVQTNLGASSPSPFNFLNPADIESISVLKDADATSIYGSRAANGAILITTKKGKAGDAKIDFNLQNGWGKVPKEVKLMNTQQYLQMRRQAFLNNNATPGPTDYDINGTWDTTRYTNWQKVLMGNTAQFADFQASVSGGTEHTQYLIGAGYQRQGEVVPGNYADVKGSVHFSLTSSSGNQRLKFQLTGSYLHDVNSFPSSDPTQYALEYSPNAPALYNKDGSLNWQPDSNGNSTWANPIANTAALSRITNNNLVANGVIGYTLMKGLDIKVNLGYTDLTSVEILQAPSTTAAPELRSTFQRYSDMTFNNINSWLIEPQLTYNTVIGKARLEAVAGLTGQQRNSNGTMVTSWGFPSDLLLGSQSSATNWNVMTTTANVYKYDAGFARVNFNWDDRYILNLTARRDGSSRFGDVNQFHTFASAGAAWIFTKTKAAMTNLDFLSLGKLSASYGSTGNDQIGDYQFLSTYGTYGYGNPYQGTAALMVNGLSNPYLQWELTTKANIALDLGFFQDRILLKADYFRNRSSNQLLFYQLPSITGSGGIMRNFPATVQNSGLELTLTTVNVKSRDFRWTTSINFTLPRNKLVAFPNIDSTSYANNFRVGKPINALRVLNFAGVDPQTGMYQFIGADGKLTTTPNGVVDNTQWIDMNPQFYGGIDNTLSYKGFSIDFLFQFQKRMGNDEYERLGLIPGYFTSRGFINGNQPVSIVNKAWTKPGDKATVQAYDQNFSFLNGWENSRWSTAGYTDASFIRLKNVSVSWQAPEKWRHSLHTRTLRLYVQGENLLTFTHYPGLDPETPGGGAPSLPPLRVITGGIQLGL